MSTKTLFAFVTLLLAGIIITGCSSAAAAPEVQTQIVERPPVPVEVTQAETGNIAAILSYTGNLRPTQNLSLVSIVAGAVEDVLVEVGDEVRAGDPVLRVEDTTYKAQLKQAEAGLTVAQTNLLKMKNGPRPEQIEMAEVALNAAKAQLEGVTTLTDDERTLAAASLAQAEAGLRLAQAQYDKIKWAGQAGMTPQALQLQQATIAYETARAAYNLQANPDDTTLAQLRAGIRQAELNLELLKNPLTAEDFALARAGIAQAEGIVALAQYQVDNVVLRAPFNGIIAEVYATVGSVAGPQLPAVKLIAKNLEAQIEVPENQIISFYDDQPAALKVSAYPNQDFPALVTSVAPAADDTSHTFPVIITPIDPESRLRAGMFAEAAILLEERTGVVLVPRSAVTTVGGRDVIYVVSEDETTVRMRPVKTGLSDDGRIEITNGLSVGETIVTAGLSNLSDGANINITARAE